MKKIFFAALLFTIHFSPFTSVAQQTFPVNGVQDLHEGAFAFTHATIAVDYKTMLSDATLLIRDGKIEAVGINISIAAGVTVIDCKGKFIYPSFIDMFSNYGIAKTETQNNNQQGPQFISNKSGAYNWNQAVKPEENAADIFSVDESQSKSFRSLGFGAMLVQRFDGIMRGTGAMVALRRFDAHGVFDGNLLRRTGDGCRQGSRAIPHGAAGKTSASRGRAQAGGGEGRLGNAARRRQER